MTWSCKEFSAVKTKPTKPATEQDQQYEKILKILLADIDTLKEELDAAKNENGRLSELVVKKSEVIYKLENVIHDIVPQHLERTSKEYTAKPKSQPNPTQPRHTKNLEETGPDVGGGKEAGTPNQIKKDCPLLIEDSLIRETAGIIQKQDPQKWKQK